MHPSSKKAKGHRGSPNPREKGRSKDPMNCSFTKKTWLQVGSELGPRALHPSSIPCPSHPAILDEKERVFGLGASFGKWVEGTVRKGTKITKAPPPD